MSKNRICVYVDAETMEVINFIMETYGVNQSTAVRAIAKVFKGVILDGQESEDKRGGA